MHRYALSARQRKDIVERCVETTIALPLDWQTSGDDDADPLAFARAALDLPPTVHLVSADVDEVPVRRTAGGDGQGLTGLLGVILTEAEAARQWHCVIVVCLATLRSRRAPQSVNERPQWPGACIAAQCQPGSSSAQ